MAMSLTVHMAMGEQKYPGIIKKLLREMLSGISYCHSQGVLHRDLKPENLLVDACTHLLKIADFGLARAFLTPDSTLSPEVVTLGFRAPEILMRSDNYSTPVDMWSVGCIFAEMVNMKPLFKGQTQIAALPEIFRCYSFINEETWPGVTLLPDFPRDFSHYPHVELATAVPKLEPAGVDLLSKFLCLNPNKRISAQDTLGHEYLQDIGE